MTLHGASRARDGERHPGLPERGSLRGALLERRPRSVRHVPIGSLPVGRSRRRQRVSPGSPRRGTCLRARTRRTNPARAAPPVRRRRDASFTRSRDLAPVVRWVSLVARRAGRRRAARRGAARIGPHRLRANLLCRRNRRRGAPGRTDASSPRVTVDLARDRPRAASEPGRRSRPPSRTRGHEELVAVLARTSLFRCRSRQAASWSRISSGSRPSEKRRGGSERGPSSVQSSAVPRGSVGEGVE